MLFKVLILTEAGTIDGRIELLEKAVSENTRAISELVTAIQRMSDILSEIQETTVPSGEITKQESNPWADLTSDLIIRAVTAPIMRAPRIILPIEQRYETYKPTLDALRSDDAREYGLTADEVSSITGRARNTESAYLWRLAQAKILERERKDGKIYYKIRERPNLSANNTET